MPIRQYKPTSAGRRGMSVADFTDITKSTPERGLLEPRQRSGGRNALGRMTTRHRGGGHKRRYRLIDFKRNKDGVPARVAAIEYDPNRSARPCTMSRCAPAAARSSAAAPAPPSS